MLLRCLPILGCRDWDSRAAAFVAPSQPRPTGPRGLGNDPPMHSALLKELTLVCRHLVKV